MYRITSSHTVYIHTVICHIYMWYIHDVSCTCMYTNGSTHVRPWGLSMEFFKYGAVMPPKLCDVSKMTV